MNTRSQIMIIVFAVLIVSGSIEAQSPLLTNPSSLSQFPTVEQLKAGVKGTDEVDNHARFMAALHRINSMIIDDLVKAPNGGTYNLPPAAETVQRRYSNAITRFSIDEPPTAARDPRYRTLEDKYEKDPAFLDTLLTQFFPPKFRTDYYAWIRKPVPQSSTQVAVRPASLDPSIAKAKAAKVDLGVFGLEIGQPVQLPVCPSGFGAQAQQTCLNNPRDSFSGSKLLDSIFGIPAERANSGFDPNVLHVHLDQEHCPEWMSGCDLEGILESGRLIAVTVNTWGRAVEKSVTAELKEKYGPPTTLSLHTFTPDVGNSINVKDPEWILPGLRVEYQIINHLNEREIDPRYGWIRVITESAYQRIANAKKQIKRKM